MSSFTPFLSESYRSHTRRRHDRVERLCLCHSFNLGQNSSYCDAEACLRNRYRTRQRLWYHFSNHTPRRFRERVTYWALKQPLAINIAPRQIGLNRSVRCHVSAPGLQPQHDRGRCGGEKRVRSIATTDFNRSPFKSERSPIFRRTRALIPPLLLY